MVVVTQSLAGWSAVRGPRAEPPSKSLARLKLKLS